MVFTYVIFCGIVSVQERNRRKYVSINQTGRDNQFAQDRWCTRLGTELISAIQCEQTDNSRRRSAAACWRKWYKGYEEKLKDVSNIHFLNNKLIKLGDNMNTKTAKKMAKERIKFIKAFIDEYLKEWNAKYWYFIKKRYNLKAGGLLWT